MNTLIDIVKTAITLALIVVVFVVPFYNEVVEANQTANLLYSIHSGNMVACG